MNLEEAKAGARKKIEEDYMELRRNFEADNFEAMADILGEYTVLISPQGERLQGKDSLARFWKGEKKVGVAALEFDLKHLHVREIKDVIKKEKPEDNIVHVAHETSEFRLITESKNCTGDWQRPLLHPNKCVWEP